LVIKPPSQEKITRKTPWKKLPEYQVNNNVMPWKSQGLFWKWLVLRIDSATVSLLRGERGYKMGAEIRMHGYV
jgi:hypothetical protein